MSKASQTRWRKMWRKMGPGDRLRWVIEVLLDEKIRLMMKSPKPDYIKELEDAMFTPSECELHLSDLQDLYRDMAGKEAE